MGRIKSVIRFFFLLCCTGLVLVFNKAAAEGISIGIELCLNRIIPSIFPMMLISCVVVECGYAGKIGRALSPVTSRLFGLPGQAGTAVLLSVIGGYPAGARAVAALYERGEITKEQASCMAQFCFCAGPAFLVGVVGGITGSAAAGWLLLGVQLAAVIITGMLVCRKNKPHSAADAGIIKEQMVDRSLSDGIVVSVSRSAAAVVQVCLYVVIFSSVRQIIDASGAGGMLEAIFVSAGMRTKVACAVLPVLMEVTGGCVSAAGAGLPMIAFAVGFGGCAVHMQVFALTAGLDIKRGDFLMARIFQGTISALITAAVIGLMPDRVSVAASAGVAGASLSGSVQGAVMLLIMCVMWLMCVTGDRVIPSEAKPGK